MFVLNELYSCRNRDSRSIKIIYALYLVRFIWRIPTTESLEACPYFRINRLLIYTIFFFYKVDVLFRNTFYVVHLLILNFHFLIIEGESWRTFSESATRVAFVSFKKWLVVGQPSLHRFVPKETLLRATRHRVASASKGCSLCRDCCNPLSRSASSSRRFLLPISPISPSFIYFINARICIVHSRLCERFTSLCVRSANETINRRVPLVLTALDLPPKDKLSSLPS